MFQSDVPRIRTDTTHRASHISPVSSGMVHINGRNAEVVDGGAPFGVSNHSGFLVQSQTLEGKGGIECF